MKIVRLAIAAISAFVLTAPIATADSARQQAARDRVDQFVATINTGEQAAWGAFVRENWLPPPAGMDTAEVYQRRMGIFEILHQDLGPVRLHEIAAVSDTDIFAIIQGTEPAGSFEWVRLQIWIDSLPPYKVRMMGADGAPDPTLEFPTGELTPEKIAAFMNRKLETLVARDAFSGTVLIAKDGRPIYTYVAGEAEKRHHVPNKLDTKFNLGSMNKMFTGVAIAQLAEQGKLSFTDKVGTHLPDYPNARVRDEITIHHLLTHTSGLGDYFEPLFKSTFWEIRTVQGYADLFADDSLLFPPGDRFQYSNAGPIVLGLIIEKITGQTYYDYIREHVTGPAGMTNTDCFEIDDPVENLAMGYAPHTFAGEPVDGWRTNLFMHSVKGGPAGGGYSTVEDLLAFANALRNGTILSPAYVDTVITGKVESWGGEKYAYLFSDLRENGHRMVGHGGGAPGINAKLDIYWGEPYTVCVMANYGGAASTVAEHAQLLFTR